MEQGFLQETYQLNQFTLIKAKLRVLNKKQKKLFIRKAHPLKTAIFWDKKVLKAGQAKCPGATRNQTFSRNILAKLFFILIEAELRLSNVKLIYCKATDWKISLLWDTKGLKVCAS